MKTRKIYFLLPSIVLAAGTLLSLTACSQQTSPKTDDPLAESGRTVRTEQLASSLRQLTDSTAFLFGHHDDTVYGIGWEADFSNDSTVAQRSDVQSCVGDLPAVLSFDLGHLELGDSLNLDGVPFSRIRAEIIRHFNHGGMVTLSWHLDNPLSGGTSWVADSLRSVETHTVKSVLEGGEKHDLFLTWLDRAAAFFCSLETDEGVRVPVLFRPWHEHTGSWFWWGQDHCTPEEYQALWKLTVQRLREQGVTNVLYAYSPGTESGGDAAKYLERYPGDEIIDVLGLDTYCGAPEADTAKVAQYAANLEHHLKMVRTLAAERHKAAALTETGYEGIKTADWWTHTLAPVLLRQPVCYVVVWRNARERPSHHYAPYPGHPSADDFVAFYNMKETLFLRDLSSLYSNNPKQ